MPTLKSTISSYLGRFRGWRNLYKLERNKSSKPETLMQEILFLESKGAEVLSAGNGLVLDVVIGFALIVPVP